MISFVDLPGIGTTNYGDLQTYLENVPLKNYDKFLIFTQSRFTNNDLQLAKTVKSLGKSFFLVRTNIDSDCTPKEGKAPINEEEMLQKIRNDLEDNVKDLISSEKEIFLIGNYDKDKWDFDRLIEAISNSLPRFQKECLILSLSNVTRESLKERSRFLKVRITYCSMIISNWINMHSVFKKNNFIVSIKLIDFCICVIKRTKFWTVWNYSGREGGGEGFS